MRLLRVLLALGGGAGALAGGCAGSAAMSPEQRRALQTRTVEASRDDVLNAAATAMIDEGLLFTLADGDAGLVGASSAVGTSAGAQCHQCANPTFIRAVTVWVREAGVRRSEVRVVTGDGGAEPTMVTRVITAIERRLPGPAGASTSGVGR